MQPKDAAEGPDLPGALRGRGGLGGAGCVTRPRARGHTARPHPQES